MPPWTTQQVVDAAPDAASLKAAYKLATPGPWSDTGSNDTLIWGKCQGSGKTPYQVSVDVVRPAYRCSCPSRKFPCKHALALMLMWAGGDGEITASDQAADFAAEWQAQAAATKAARESRPAKPVDEAAQAKRLAARLELMDAGVADFSLWLQDLVRTGFAAARSQPHSWWQATAARLVDAQLPGLADQVRELASELMRREDWTDLFALTVGRWWLAVRAWQRRETLDPETLADLRVVLGWTTTTTDEVRSGEAVTDTWQVIGSHRSDDGRVQQQRTWLYGQANRDFQVVLDFAAGTAALPMALAVGTAFDGAVHRYPGHAPHRVIAEPATAPSPVPGLPPGLSVAQNQERYAAALAENPWLTRLPMIVEGLRFGVTGVADAADRALPYSPGFDPNLALALTGGSPHRCFGELDEGHFRPLSLDHVGEVFVL